MKKALINTIVTGSLLLYSLIVAGQTAEMFIKAAGTPADPKVQVSWNRYYTYTGITDLVKKMASAYPDLVTLSSMGKSFQGREMWVLTISDKKAGDPERKPGFWIDGNIHSIEIQGTEMALYCAWYLTEMY
ncbi:MAG TPA: M14 family zinc carboxypeptidase, partial [Bacteroidales bacterium]|nr:M14 family zinc carboxypeptidase [Bacteroidales bacterium]